MTQPTGYVIDASVLVAGIHPGEMHHAEARLALARLTQQQVTLFLPTIALAEVAAAIARGTGSTEQANRDVALIRRLAGVEIVSVTVALGELAADIAARQHIRGCDAVYVALAQELGAALITLDRQQRQRTPPTVTTLSPSQALAEL